MLVLLSCFHLLESGCCWLLLLGSGLFSHEQRYSEGIFQVVEELKLKTKPEIWRPDFSLDENSIYMKNM